MLFFLLSRASPLLGKWNFYFIITISSFWKRLHFTCWHVNGSCVEFQEYVLVVFILAIIPWGALLLPNEMCFKHILSINQSSIGVSFNTFLTHFIFDFKSTILLWYSLYDMCVLSVTAIRKHTMYGRSYTTMHWSWIHVYNVLLKCAGTT